jgi:hypothetical protein
MQISVKVKGNAIKKYIQKHGVYGNCPHCTPEDELGQQDGATGPDNPTSFSNDLGHYRACDNLWERRVYKPPESFADYRGGANLIDSLPLALCGSASRSPLHGGPKAQRQVRLQPITTTVVS